MLRLVTGEWEVKSAEQLARRLVPTKAIRDVIRVSGHPVSAQTDVVRQPLGGIVRPQVSRARVLVKLHHVAELTKLQSGGMRRALRHIRNLLRIIPCAVPAPRSSSPPECCLSRSVVRARTMVQDLCNGVEFLARETRDIATKRATIITRQANQLKLLSDPCF